ncbi:MAG: cytochrome P450 [Actinomycetota bacterium]|nr:cytochrome P450 [Actinomycetota bacterium]
MGAPEHTRYRKIVNRAFTPARVAALEPQVRAVTRELLDTVVPGTFDLTTEVAMPLPMRVIADMIGAPPEDRARIMRWGNALVASTDPEYRAPADEQLDAAAGLLGYFAQMRERRAGEPGDDLCSVLMAAEVDGERLSPVRFNFFLLLLAVAGNETTRNAISHGVAAFAHHPEQWARLRAEPELVPLAVEEILRWASPVAHFRRTAIAPMELRGERIEVGDVVSLWYPSANRDEDVFTDPDTFDVGRDPNPQIAFGGGGPHFCLGASLARLELRVVLEELLDRVDHIELTGEIDHLRSHFLNGVKHLPVRLMA